MLLGLVVGALNACLLIAVLLRLQRIDRHLSIKSDGEGAATPRRHGGGGNAGLERLRARWQEDRRSFEPEIEADPYLSPTPDRLDKLLSRFLKAENGDVEAAAQRLRSTAEWRASYRCVDLHRPGMARRLFMHKSNPGAAMYFGDFGLRDRSGEPVLVGRNLQVGALKPADAIVPCTHIRAAMLVIDRCACECDEGGSYILDVGPAAECADMAAVVAGERYWDADGAIDEHAAVAEGRAPSPSVGPHPPHHLLLQPGLPTLKEAMALMTAHYPELLRRVYFYRPTRIFQMLFAVFSRWLPRSTRAKLVMVRPGEEHRFFFSRGAPGGGCDPATTPRELGGLGPSLGGDAFLAEAVARYDRTATLALKQ